MIFLSSTSQNVTKCSVRSNKSVKHVMVYHTRTSDIIDFTRSLDLLGVCLK